MTESFLLTFLKNVYLENLDYCVVCLRSAQERRLVKPNYVKKFATSINQPFMLNDPNHMACYLCERQAAAAFRYRKAANLATYAINFMACLKKDKKKCHMIRTCNADKTNKPWLASVLNCESEMVEQRARSQLLLTEVLVISSLSEQISSRVDSTDVYVVPDDVPRESVSEIYELSQKPEEGMSSIIIYDDEDDPININTEIISSNNPIEVTNDPLAQKNDPLSLNTSQNPTNNLVPNNNILETSMVGEMSMIDTNTTIEKAPTNFLLHPIIFNSGMMTVPSLSANIVDGKLVTNNNEYSNVFGCGTPQLALQVGENLDLICDPNKVASVLRVLSHQDAGKVHVFTCGNQDTSQGSNVQKTPPNSFLDVNKNGGPILPTLLSKPRRRCTYTPVIEVGNTCDPLISKNPAPVNISPPNKIPQLIKYVSKSKNPSGIENPSVGQHPPRGGPALLRADRIDWEDKIPMDVISFVDKNDTITKRPRWSICPTSLGISDVVSLNDEDVIIDLC